MNVLITLANQKEPIKATIPNFEAGEFTSMLNDHIVFINLGGNVINRNLIQMIVPDQEETQA